MVIASVGYQKCFEYDEERVNGILNAIEEHVVKPYKNRLEFIYIADEFETNEPSVRAIDLLIKNIRSRSAFSQKNDKGEYKIKIWVNYDNVERIHSGAHFVINQGVDVISLTPSYGRSFERRGEMPRYRILLSTAANLRPKPKLMVIGDAWAGHEADKDSKGNLTSVGQIHLAKVSILYNDVVVEANKYGIEVIGSIPFAYSFPGPFSLSTSHDAVKNEWIKHAKKVITGQDDPTPTPIPLPPINTTPIPTPTPNPGCEQSPFAANHKPYLLD